MVGGGGSRNYIGGGGGGVAVTHYTGLTPGLYFTVSWGPLATMVPGNTRNAVRSQWVPTAHAFGGAGGYSDNNAGGSYGGAVYMGTQGESAHYDAYLDNNSNVQSNYYGGASLYGFGGFYAFQKGGVTHATGYGGGGVYGYGVNASQGIVILRWYP